MFNLFRLRQNRQHWQHCCRIEATFDFVERTNFNRFLR